MIFVSNVKISVKDTLNFIKELMESDLNFVCDDERIKPEKSEVFRLWSDNTKVKKLISFAPNIDIKEGFEKTIDWFTKPENLMKYKADIYNV